LTENAQLFDAHRAGLCRYLTRIVGQPDTARDLTQEVFLRASRTTVPEGSAEGQRAWVFRIARNLALNHLRDQQRKPPTTALVDVGRTGTQELSVAVQQALEALPALDRDVFLLTQLERLWNDVG
jgi:RNA polymerase sigma factor (sigma-70 family)